MAPATQVDHPEPANSDHPPSAVSLRVAVIYNEPRLTQSDDHWLSKTATKGFASEHTGAVDFIDASEHGVLAQMKTIVEALERPNIHITPFSIGDSPKALAEFLATYQIDCIFNCCESLRGDARLEMNVAALYELFGIPFTGSPAAALSLALNKSVAKDLFRAHGVSTPAYFTIDSESELSSMAASDDQFPMIVKPMREDASNGITENSVVRNIEELRRQVRFILEEFHQPAIVEEYIDGREFNVGLLWNTRKDSWETLPISEITFEDFPDQPRIVSYKAKWVEESVEYKTTVPVCPAQLPHELQAEAREIAKRAADVIGLRGYGRIDLRLRESDQKFFVLEANPNPDISDDAGFMRAARASGRTYGGTITEILFAALNPVDAQRFREFENAAQPA